LIETSKQLLRKKGGAAQMLSKNQRPVYFTDGQLQQLRRNTDSLRKLNRVALGALRRIGYTVVTDSEYRDAGDSFSMVASRMGTLLRVRRELLAAGREQLPQRIEVIFGGKCDACWENGPFRKLDDPAADPREALEPDPAHLSETEALLDLAMRTEGRVSVRRESRRAPLRAFFLGISRLTWAVLRQQRELREAAFKHVPETKVARSDNCADCHKPMETEDEEDNLATP
jgi:hypothetical protein